MHTILYSRRIAWSCCSFHSLSTAGQLRHFLIATCTCTKTLTQKMDLKQCTPGLGIKIWQFKTRVCALGQNKPNYKCMSTLRQIQLEHTHTHKVR